VTDQPPVERPAQPQHNVRNESSRRFCRAGPGLAVSGHAAPPLLIVSHKQQAHTGRVLHWALVAVVILVYLTTIRDRF
jgi:hypothetical protein